MPNLFKKKMENLTFLMENNTELFHKQHEISNSKEITTFNSCDDGHVVTDRKKSNIRQRKPGGGKQMRNLSQAKEKPEVILNCDICNAKFNSELRLKKHRKGHDYEKPYQCDQCSESFNVLENLTLHISVHNKEQFRCPQCGKLFSRLASLEGHIKTHFKNEFFTCSLCGDMFYILAKFKQHLYTVHPNNKYQLQVDREEKAAQRRIEKGRKKVCQICSKAFSKNFLLQRHERIHKNLKPYKCDECEKAFTQKYSLVIHQLKHSGERPHQCLSCPQRFAQKGNLYSHMYRCHSNIEQQFSCHLCPCSFRKNRSLNNHITKYHSWINTYDAGVDDVMRQLNEIQRPDPLEDQYALIEVVHRKETNMTNNSSNLNGVAENDSGKTPAIAVPTQTTKEVTVVRLNDFAASNASVHNVIQHRIEGQRRTLICSFCGKGFNRPSDMIRHIRIHTKEKPFECDICHRKFNVKGTLQSHMRLHNKNTPIYPCALCKKRFKSSKSLNMHCRMRHPNVERSESSNSLQNHSEISNNNVDNNSTVESLNSQNAESGSSSKQTKLTILRCDICKKSFETTQTFNRHILEHNQSNNQSVVLTHYTINDQPTITDNCSIVTDPLQSGIIPINNIAPVQNVNDSAKEALDSNVIFNQIRYELDGHEYFLVFTQQPIDECAPNENQLSNDEIPNPSNISQENQLEPIPEDNSNDDHIENAQREDNSTSKSKRETGTTKLLDREINEKVKAILRENKKPTILKNQKPRNYHCDQCDKSFLKPIDLRRHQRTHTGERPFECTQCAKTFSLMCTLNTHLKTHEGDQKITFPCHICANQFSSKYSLQVHMRIHTGIRPYKCSFCTLTFRTNGHRSQHMKVHIREASRQNAKPELIKTRKEKNKIKSLYDAFSELNTV